MDPYALLGVSPRASERDVRRAYRRVVRTLHPDLQPEHLRDASGRRLQAVNTARAQVLDEIRRRAADGAAPSATEAVPAQRRPLEEPGAAARWVERQAWLLEEQQGIDAWNHGRRSRERRRRSTIDLGHERRRRILRRRRAWGVVPLLVIVTLQVGLVLALVHGVESALMIALSGAKPAAPTHDELDLREVLALLGSWTS